MSGGQRAHGVDDGVTGVGDDPHFAQVDAEAGQFAGEEIHVGIAGAPGQNLVPDHDHGGGWV